MRNGWDAGSLPGYPSAKLHKEKGAKYRKTRLKKGKFPL
jgi:hypothetical protein